MPEPIEWTAVPKSPMLKSRNTSQKKRLEICYQCPELDLSGCKVCGCSIEIKTANKQESCPLNKW